MNQLLLCFYNIVLYLLILRDGILLAVDVALTAAVVGRVFVAGSENDKSYTV